VKLIIFGPPGSGKGTYASRLEKTLGTVTISTGGIFRQAIKQGTPLGRKAAVFLNKGELVPDEVTVEVLRERIRQPDVEKGFILDGFPRTVKQAEQLDKLTKIDVVINLILPERILVEKLSARRICRRCGEIYNLADIRTRIGNTNYLLPPMLPQKPDICDKCGGELYTREDDEPEVIRERLRVYQRQSKPVIRYYKDKVPFVNISVNRPPDVVTRRILKALQRRINTYLGNV